MLITRRNLKPSYTWANLDEGEAYSDVFCRILGQTFAEGGFIAFQQPPAFLSENIFRYILESGYFMEVIAKALSGEVYPGK